MSSSAISTTSNMTPTSPTTIPQSTSSPTNHRVEELTNNNHAQLNELLHGNNSIVLNTSDETIRNQIVQLIIQYLQNEGFYQSASTLVNEKEQLLDNEKKSVKIMKSIFECIESGDWTEVERLVIQSAIPTTSSPSAPTPTASATNSSNIAPLSSTLTPTTTTATQLSTITAMTTSSTPNAVSVSTPTTIGGSVNTPSDDAKLLQQQHNKSSTVQQSQQQQQQQQTKGLFHKYNQSAFLYEVYKQQFLEMIDNGEMQKAFTFLTKKLKPLKAMQAHENEFKDLCYLLTCKSVQEAPSFRNWDGPMISREKLIEKLRKDFHLETKELTISDFSNIPGNRLNTLLNQAATYQVIRKAHLSHVPPRVTSLLSDYETFIIPNSLKFKLVGHMENVKCVQFLGSSPYLASGSSDNTIRIWNMKDKVINRKSESSGSAQEDYDESVCLSGHLSRIWDLTYSNSANLLASGSGDATVRIWNMAQYYEDSNRPPQCSRVLCSDNQRNKGDIYSVKFHQDGSHLITGSYDCGVCLYDVETGTLLKRFNGHTASVCSVTFSDVLGNMIITGSKDHTIKFWDMSSGACVQTLTQHLGEVTSVDVMKNHSGHLLLSCSKDNSNRLWDTRQNREFIQRYKGHQNTNANLIRAHFGPQNEVIIGGSEDGFTYLWDLNSGKILDRLKTSNGAVFESRWNSSYEVLVSCSNDSNIKCFLQK